MINLEGYFDIQVSTECNLNCKHCLMKDNLNHKKINYEKIYDQLSNYSFIEEIHLSGGEPLIRNLQELKRFIDCFPNTKFSMTTNLIYTLTTQRIEIINSMDRVCTSFDPGNIRFENIGHLNRWYHNLKKIKLFKPDIVVFICLTDYLISNVLPEKLIHFFDKLKVNFITIPLMNIGNVKKNNYLLPDREKLVEWVKKSLSLESEFNKTSNLIDNRNFSNCQYGLIMECINYNGDFVNCISDPDCQNNLDNKCNICNKLYRCGGSCPHIDCYYMGDDYFE